MTSYQKRKRIWELSQKAEFFQKAIWEARKATSEQLGIEPFSDLCGNEEGPIISDKKGLLNIIKGLPLIWQHPGLNGDEFLTPDNCPEL